MNPFGVRLSIVLGTLLLIGSQAMPAAGCFGTRLRVGVEAGSGQALAAYVAGYYLEEKTGIAPEFVDLGSDPAAALEQGRIDLVLTTGTTRPPDGVVVRPVGDIPGMGPACFWIHADVLDDLRFFTVDRSLGLIPAFFASRAYREAHASGTPAKKAARRAVLRAD